METPPPPTVTAAPSDGDSLPPAEAAIASVGEPTLPPALKKLRPYKVQAEDKTCLKCGKVMQSRMALRLHLNRVYPCDKPKVERGDGKNLWDRYGTKTCTKCGKTFTSTGGLRLHLARVTPCDASKPTDQPIKTHKCEKCQKVFTSAPLLRKHQSRVFPCDDPNLGRAGARWGNKTCPKCHKTFSTGQSLRLHLNRVNPCDTETKGPSSHQRDGGKEGPQDSSGSASVFSCPGCVRTFTTEHGLHIHMGRKTACLQISQFAKALSAEGGVERVSKVAKTHENHEWSKEIKLATRAACLKRFDRSGNGDATDNSSEDADPPPSTSTTTKTRTENERDGSPPLGEARTQKSGKTGIGSSAELVARASRKDTHQSFSDFTATGASHESGKRSAERSSEDLSPVEEKRKRACNGLGAFAELVDRLSKGNPTATTFRKTANSSAHSDASPSDLNGNHGGDILTDGCCCRACVRMWAQKTASRLEKLSSEVVGLRSVVRQSTKETYATTTSSQNMVDNAEATHPPEDKSEIPKPATSNRFERDVEDLVKDSLVETYNHLNDRIITNERALEDSVAYLKKITDHDASSSLELRNQIDELRVYINVEKRKRDEAVAAIIAHRWDAKRSEFQLLLENMVVNCRPDAEKVFHEDCSEIFSQLDKKDKTPLELCTQIRGKYAQGKDSGALSKIELEQAAGQLLEHERDAVFMRLLRSSRRIYLLTMDKFLRQQS